MGIELKVTVQPEGAVSLFTGQDRETLLEGLKDGTSYSPNLFTTPVMLCMGTFLNPRLEGFIKTHVGEERYAALSQLLHSAVETAYGLHSAAVSGVSDLDGLVARDIFEKTEFAGYFAELSIIDAGTMDDYQRPVFEVGMEGLALGVLYCNAMYDPKKRNEFLRHVSEGVVAEDYQKTLLAGLQGNAG